MSRYYKYPSNRDKTAMVGLVRRGLDVSPRGLYRTTTNRSQDFVNKKRRGLKSYEVPFLLGPLAVALIKSRCIGGGLPSIHRTFSLRLYTPPEKVL